ncbi:PepSY domain-containing protein [Cupriavidus sp. UME77]|uniref:PepSY-associated TM helix domain-containing protein n=1 Tax=Cupriavidus sp. UME77 TaxID=1862321 RepID=UPI001DE63FF1|nr:PepSY domain-containing protein [Cupriavidus sp. UME77]MBB1631639.1 peptidase [Cupriavidus sp. UME77]
MSQPLERPPMGAQATQPSPAAAASYRMLWRWHFYAGLFVAPFLVVLAITGTIYCFQPQIESLLYPQLLRVEPVGAKLPAQSLLDRAWAQAPEGAVATTYTVDSSPRASAEFVFRLPSGKSESLYLDPYTGNFLGSLSVEDRLMKQVRMLHRALLLGKTGELLMELAACWSLVMIATGVAMWWPRLRDKGGKAFVIGKAAGGRGWWKEVHLVIGAWMAIGAVAFVLSGLPWTASWGKQFKAIATAARLGNPAGAWGDAGVRSTPGAASMDALPLAAVPWAVGMAKVPSGKPPAMGAATISLDRAVAIVAENGVSSGYQLVLPKSATGVFTASYFPADPKVERTLHIDQYTGKVLKDIRYGDYGAVAQAISYGTSLHMGRYFGLANQIACTVISLGLMMLAVTGLVMWLKRRPARALAAPSFPRTLPPMRAWVIGLGLLGAVFPMMGATLVMVWLLDRWFARSAAVLPAAPGAASPLRSGS